MKQLYVGLDPEFFAVDKNNFCIPPIIGEKLGFHRVGTLDEYRPHRHPVYYEKNELKIIGDGAAYELNMGVYVNPQDMINDVNFLLNIMKQKITKIHLRPDLSPTVKFDLNHFTPWYPEPTKSEELWMSTHFGCDPQFNAYSALADQMIDAKDYKFRHGGGHLHMSYEGENLHKEHEFLIRLCDVFVGNMILANTKFPVEEKLRGGFYGVPGNFRLTTYANDIKGLEYRSPSNSWATNAALIKKIFTRLNFLLGYHFTRGRDASFNLLTSSYKDSTLLEAAKDNISNTDIAAAVILDRDMDLLLNKKQYSDLLS